MRRLKSCLTLFWVAMIPVSLAMGWLKSVTYVSALSLWALVSGHWLTWQAARRPSPSMGLSHARRRPSAKLGNAGRPPGRVPRLEGLRHGYRGAIGDALSGGTRSCESTVFADQKESPR